MPRALLVLNFHDIGYRLAEMLPSMLSQYNPPDQFQVFLTPEDQEDLLEQVVSEAFQTVLQVPIYFNRSTFFKDFYQLYPKTWIEQAVQNFIREHQLDYLRNRVNIRLMVSADAIVFSYL